MIGVVIVAHGGLAQEYLEAIEHVVGPQPGMVAIAISPDCDRSDKQDDICAAADAVDTGQGVVVVTDLFGGSPCNLSLRACRNCQRQVLYGANLPALIKLSKIRHMPVSDAISIAIEAGRKYIGTYSVRPEQG